MRKVFLDLKIVLIVFMLINTWSTLYGQNLFTNGEIIMITDGTTVGDQWSSNKRISSPTASGQSVTKSLLMNYPTLYDRWEVIANDNGTFSFLNVGSGLYLSATSSNIVVSSTKTDWNIGSKTDTTGTFSTSISGTTYYINTGYVGDGWNKDTGSGSTLYLLKHTPPAGPSTIVMGSGFITIESDTLPASGGVVSFPWKVYLPICSIDATGQETFQNYEITNASFSGMNLGHVSNDYPSSYNYTTQTIIITASPNATTSVKTVGTMTVSLNVSFTAFGSDYSFAVQSYNQPTYCSSPLPIPIIQEAAIYIDPAKSYHLIHQVGASKFPKLANKMQAVHQIEETVYINKGETRRLFLPIPDEQGGRHLKSYYRWYDYNTDLAIPNPANLTITGGSAADYQNFATEGRFVCKAMTDNGEPGAVSYTMPSTGESITIACDASRWYDYSLSSDKNSFIEPTLTNRNLFHVKDASIIAARLDTCTGSSYLEDYYIIAPTNSTINLATQYDYLTTELSRCNYYYDAASPKKITSYTWSSGVTALGTRMGTVSTGATPGTYVYTLKVNGGTLNLARFTVHVQSVNSVGPKAETAGKAIYTNAELDERYQLADYRDFDYQDTDPSVGYCPYPLPWKEMSYGYFYSGPTAPGTAANNSNNKVVDYNQYQLLRKDNGGNLGFTTSGSLVNRSGEANGFFIGVDACEFPGKVVDFTINGDLCGGTSLLVSAWVAALNNAEIKPNLNFIIVGVNDSGEEKRIAIYTTGNLKSPDNTWYQVFFKLPLGNVSYPQYRLLVENNALGTTNGNDFAIDDVRMYVSKSPIIGFQGVISCDQSTTSEIIATLRIDYTNPEFGGYDWVNNETSFYYQWQNQSGSILNLDYLNSSNKTYGRVAINRTATMSELNTLYPGHIYSTLADFMQAAQSSTDAANFAFIEETDSLGNTTPMLYITNKSSQFVMNKKYTGIVGSSVNDLVANDCRSTSSFIVRPRTQISVDGETQSSTYVNSFCAAETYKVGINVYDTDPVSMNSIEAYCYSDYYRGDLVNLEEVKTAIWAFRNTYRTATKFDMAVTAEYTQAYKTLLMSLASKFELYKKDLDLKAPETDGKPIVYLIFPIKGTSSSGNIEICNDPIRVVLTAAVVMTFGPDASIILPEEVEKLPCTLRLSEADANGNFHLPIRSIDGAPRIMDIILYASNDPAFSEETVTFKFDSDIQNPGASSILSLTPSSGNTANFSLKGGYSYDFYTPLNPVDNPCASRAAYFNIKVVPDTLIWTPVGDNQAWNSDANWSTPTGNGYAPLSHSNIILRGNKSYYPVLSTSTEEHETEIGADEYITYDLYYQKHNCNEIYFEPGAKLINQHMLNYQKAWVDIKLNTNQWTLTSMPLKGVASGDIYIPKAGNDTPPFAALNPVDSRYYYGFNQSMFNKSVDSIANDGSSHSIKSTAWSAPFNALSEIYQPGIGVALKTEFNAAVTLNTATIRLPKAETGYYYFYSSDRPAITGDNRYYVAISRPSDYGKLSFPATSNSNSMQISLINEEVGSIFLIGNPMMADIDLKKFFAANASELTGTYWIYRDGTEASPATASGISIDPAASPYLAPISAILVEAKTPTTQLDITVSADMATQTDLSNTPNGMPSKLRKSNNVEETSILRIAATRNGCVSHAIIAENSQADPDYKQGEDAELIMMEESMTKQAIYSVANNKSLTINVLNNIDMTPLSFTSTKNNNLDTITLAFKGVNSFTNRLFLYDTQTSILSLIRENEIKQITAPLAGQLRYFIKSVQPVSTDNTVVTNESSNIRIYSSEAGMSTVYAGDIITEISIYNTIGQKIWMSEPNSLTCDFYLPSGCYLVYVQTEKEAKIIKAITK